MRIDGYYGYRLEGLDYLEFQELNGLPNQIGNGFVSTLIEDIRRGGAEHVLFTRKNSIDSFMQIGDPFGGLSTTAGSLVVIVDLDHGSLEVFNEEYSPVYTLDQIKDSKHGLLLHSPLDQLVKLSDNGEWQDFCDGIIFDIKSIYASNLSI